MLAEKRIQFCNASHILLFRYFEQGRCQRLLKIFAPYVTVYGHTRTKIILAATGFEESKNEDRTLITKTHGLSDEIFFDFRFRRFQLPVSKKQATSGFEVPPGSGKVPHAIARVKLYISPKFRANQFTHLGGDSFAHIK